VAPKTIFVPDAEGPEIPESGGGFSVDLLKEK
jgi:hypothetical protein